MLTAALVFYEGAKTVANRYQVMPRLTVEEFGALKASIREFGVVVPVVVDENGVAIDGNHRIKAREELRHEGHDVPDYPTLVRSDLVTDQQKRDEAWRLNMQRRHLNRTQKRDVIAAKLRDSPEWANNRIASLLGVDGATVNSVRIELEAAFEIPKLEQLEGEDGKKYPRYYTTSLEVQMRYAEERKRHEIRRELLQPFGRDRTDADIAEKLDVRESEVSEQRADLQEQGAKEWDYMAYPGTPEEGEARRMYLQQRAEARERGELREENSRNALKWMDNLYNALHLTDKTPSRVTPEDVAKAYLDSGTLLGYDDRTKRALSNGLIRFDALVEWMERFAASVRAEVDVWLEVEETNAEQRRRLEEVTRLNQKWKES